MKLSRRKFLHAAAGAAAVPTVVPLASDYPTRPVHLVIGYTAPAIVFGRVALVGDAAANARPHMGFGMAKAATDAQALAKQLSAHDDIDTALKAYNAERQPIGNTIVRHGRKLGCQLGVNLKTDQERGMHDLLQSDGAMLDWIAVPNFLAAYR